MKKNDEEAVGKYLYTHHFAWLFLNQALVQPK